MIWTFGTQLLSHRVPWYIPKSSRPCALTAFPIVLSVHIGRRCKWGDLVEAFQTWISGGVAQISRTKISSYPWQAFCTSILTPRSYPGLVLARPLSVLCQPLGRIGMFSYILSSYGTVRDSHRWVLSQASRMLGVHSFRMPAAARSAGEWSTILGLAALFDGLPIIFRTST